MVGIRSQENNKFVCFFERLQKEADNNGCVFFLDCGEGREFSTDILEGEDLTGWLIPKSKADEFGRLFADDANLDEWSEYLTFCEWSLDHGSLSFRFEKLP